MRNTFDKAFLSAILFGAGAAIFPIRALAGIAKIPSLPGGRLEVLPATSESWSRASEGIILLPLLPKPETFSQIQALARLDLRDPAVRKAVAPASGRIQKAADTVLKRSEDRLNESIAAGEEPADHAHDGLHLLDKSFFQDHLTPEQHVRMKNLVQRHRDRLSPQALVKLDADIESFVASVMTPAPASAVSDSAPIYDRRVLAFQARPVTIAASPLRQEMEGVIGGVKEFKPVPGGIDASILGDSSNSTGKDIWGEPILPKKHYGPVQSILRGMMGLP